MRVTRRLRLAFLYAALFTVAHAVLVFAAWAARGAHLRKAFDVDLLHHAAATAGRLSHDIDAWVEDDLGADVAASRELLHVEVWSMDGRLEGTSSSRLSEAIPALDVTSSPGDALVRSLPLPRLPEDVDVADEVREATVRFRSPSGTIHVVRALSRTNPRDSVHALLLDRLGASVPLAFLASLVVSWLLVRSALEPLEDVQRAMAKIRPDTLGTAVDVDRPDDEAIAGLQLALNDALARLEEGYQSQSRFVANAAHELKTPIAVLLAEAQSLRADKATQAELLAFRESVIQEMRRLGAMIESFLVVARSRRGGDLTRQEPVSLLDVVVESVAACSAVASTNSVRVVPRVPETDEMPEVSGDPELLCSMLGNLIRNAIKFAPQDSAIDVTLEQSEGVARIRVRDRGPGIPEGFETRLFDRYVQAPGHGARRGGFGLGLSIAVNVARLHGGDISASNHADGGAEFVIELPVGGDDDPSSARSGRPVEV